MEWELFGDGMIAVSAHEATLLDGYIKMRKSLQFSEVSPYVFVNYTGSQMIQSNVASALTVLLESGALLSV